MVALQSEETIGRKRRRKGESRMKAGFQGYGAEAAGSAGGKDGEAKVHSGAATHMQTFSAP